MSAIASHTQTSIKSCAILTLTTLLLACGNNNTQNTKLPQPASTQTQPQSPPTTDNTIQNSQEPTKDTNTKATATTDPKVLAIGKARYEQTCHLCHTQGLLNAPKPNDKVVWQSRLAKGMDTLKQSAVQGFGKMPAQAIDSISKEEVESAVEYMVSQIPQ